MGPVVIDRMDERMTAVEAALKAALPTRVVKRSFLKHYDDHAAGEIERGVVMLISADEGGYNTAPGMQAKEGTHRMLLACHIKVAESGAQIDVEKAELKLAEEIKSFVRQGVVGMHVALDRVIHSRQLEYPYGWVVAYLDVGRPVNMYG